MERSDSFEPEHSVAYHELLAALQSGQAQLREAEDRFRLLVETIPGVVYIAEPGEYGVWHYVSPRLQELLGYSTREWTSSPSVWVDSIHPEDRAQVLEDEQDWIGTTKGVFAQEYRIRARDGSYRWVHDAATARPGEDADSPVLWFGVMSDITGSREAQEALRHSEQLLRSVLETAQDAFVAVDDTGRVLEWNRRAEVMFGRRRDDALGHSFGELALPQRLQALELFAPTTAVMAGQTLELMAQHSSGAEFPTELTVWPTTSGRSQRYNVFIRDITERARMQDELRILAFADALTGLPNRSRFLDLLDAALRAQLAQSSSGQTPTLGRNPAQVVVMFLDIDDFKVVNDSLGHPAGDRLLTIVADRLRRCVRPGDTVARFAGDEFAVLLPAAPDTEHAVLIAERIAAALREPLTLEGRKTSVSVSVGVAFSEADAPVTAVDLLRNSDTAMYEAKRSGKNRCVVYDPDMHAAAVARLELKSDLTHAVEDGQLALDYQPYFDLADGCLVGFEALIRWDHPIRHRIGPAEFIPLAEEVGLIHRIGEWVLDEACRHAVGWREQVGAESAPCININVSTLQLQEPGFVDMVRAVLSRTGLAVSRLVLEVTEGVLLRRLDKTVAVLAQLRRLGIRIAIDDFGTGYSSLSYLQNLPVDILKIDRAFLDGLGTDRNAASMARLIVQIGQTLDLRVIAEGVERQEQLDSLQDLGCDSAQGFLLGTPMSAAGARALVAGPSGREPHPAISPLAVLPRRAH